MVALSYTGPRTVCGLLLMPSTLADLRAKAAEYLSPEQLSIMDEAYQVAMKAHDGQVRFSGEPYLGHPLATALLVADLRLDVDCLAAALLHDVPEDCGVPLEQISERFGAEVGRLVGGLTRLDKLSSQAQQTGIESRESQVDSLRKMFLVMADDIRVALIKLGDRLHNMRTLKALPAERQRRVAQETMEIYAPLAHRLGIWQFRWELEDLAFRYLEPKKYSEVSRLIALRRETREKYVDQVCALLGEELSKAGIEAEVSGRPKSIYSVYTKMGRYATQGKEFSDIHDLFALRVLGRKLSDCYSALGVVHSLWHPLPGTFDDFIGNPRGGVYQALHTTVMCLGARPVEIQIRTHEMHRLAEYGVAAHWRYKEGGKADMKFEERIAWLRQLMEWQREFSGTAFLESLKADFFADQVFVYTPKGEIRELPAGASPLDFAYRIHTDLGHRCIGAKVNGRLVSLNYELQNGDTVEIMVAKQERGPSLDWLNQDLGLVRTRHAQEKIRQWFRKQER
ncbi:RelA/SpoT family protein, partial [Chloroflexota bacterium]